MKKIIYFFVMFFVVLSIPKYVFAVQSESNGIIVNTNKDKEEYDISDEAEYTITITNTNTYDVCNVGLKLSFDKNIIIDNNEIIGNVTINAGEIVTKNVKLKYKAVSNNDIEKNSSIISSPATGDRKIKMIYVFVLITSGSIIYICKKKHSRLKKIISSILCVIIAVESVMTIGNTTYAADNKKFQFNIKDSIIFDKESSEINLELSYDYDERMNGLEIDTGNFIEISENKYELVKELDILHGTLENPASYDKIEVHVYNNDEEVYTNSIDSKEEWSFEKIGLFPGENQISVKAVGKNSVSDSIVLIDYLGFNYNNIDESDVDTDGDGLPDLIEQHIRTDIDKKDTDGDGLTDYQEIVDLNTNPLKKDTDNNGITDYNEDADNDSLANGFEYLLGTCPILADTDGDGLDDGDEYNRYKTDPLKNDTDGDGSDDMWEIANGFDPLIYNQNFNLHINYSEVSEIYPVVPELEITLSGEQAESLTITPVNNTDNYLISSSIAGYLGCAYNFTVDGTFDSAKLIFNYDIQIGNIGDEFQPRIYYLNEDTGFLEELENQTVENGRVIATITHFSTYILLNKIEFDKVWDTEIRKPSSETDETITEGVDIVFIIDSSGSMQWNDKKNIRLMAAKKFVDKLGENDRGAVIDFDHQVILLQDFTNDHDILKEKIDRINASGGTDLSIGMAKAISLFTEPSYIRNNIDKYIIFLTDGDGPYIDSYTNEAANNGIVVYTVGLGDGVIESKLKNIAEGTGGKYYFASTADTLPDIYEDISNETIDYITDTNNDGISDYYTQLIYEGKITTSTGESLYKGIDLNYNKNSLLSNDYDGDGLTNGQEIIICNNGDYVYYKVISDPTLVHSDLDGIDDYTEIQNKTDPLVKDYNKFYVDYLTDNDNYYYESYVENVYDDNLLYQIDSAFLSIITLNWNIKAIFKDILIDYFDKYIEDVNQYADTENRKQIVNNLDSLYQKASELEGKIEDAKYYKDLLANIKNLIDVCNGYTSNIESITAEYVKIAKTIAIYDPRANTIILESYKMSSTSINLVITKSNLKASDLDKFGLALNIASGTLDIANTINSFSKVNANQKSFSENIDFLTEIKNNGSREAIRIAASDIISKLSGKYAQVIASYIGDDLLVMSAHIIETIASKNPYVAAVVFVRDLIDKITGLSDTLEREYKMLTYDSMSTSAKNMIYANRDISAIVYYDKTGNLEKHLKNLIQIRILGENMYRDYYSHGAVSWGVDEEKLNKNISISKDNVIYCADNLKVNFSSKLRRN